MIYSTKGVVVRTIAYGETGIIANIYTERFGTLAFLVNGVRKAKTSFKYAYFQPLTLVELQIYKKDNRDLHKIKEIKPLIAGLGLREDILKSTIAFFIAEVLYKSLREEDPNQNLFDFVEHSIAWLDETPFSIANFHISFMLELTRYLGFYPSTENMHYPTFDLQDGVFRDLYGGGRNNCITSPIIESFCLFLNQKIYESHSIQLNKAIRKELLTVLIWYYRLHLPNWGELKTLEVLESTLN